MGTCSSTTNQPDPRISRNQRHHSHPGRHSHPPRRSATIPRASSHSPPTLQPPKPADNVSFVDFRPKEKNLVESVLMANDSLRYASVNFSDLQLECIIGQGSFGEVIRGKLHGTPVVVKRMLRQHITEKQLELFATEIRFMMNLRHPNIVQFIGGSWNSYSNICFVTEYMEKGSLFHVLHSSKPLEWVEPKWRMLLDVARGMAYLHGLDPPVIHRDLKSMNILVNGNYGCKVSDFGLCREKCTQADMTVCGTPLWLPPEMIRGERYTENADVYSFGIVISEMDTRKIPYSHVSSRSGRKVGGTALLHKVAYGKLRPLLSPNCLPSLVKMFEACTHDNPMLRPNFGEICKTLENEVKQEIQDIAF